MPSFVPESCPAANPANTRGSCDATPLRKPKSKRTFERRETSVENELQVAQLPLGKDNRLKLLSLVVKLLAPRRIARDQVLKDTA